MQGLVVAERPAGDLTLRVTSAFDTPFLGGRCAETSKADKAVIRNALPAGLRDPDSKIRTAVAMAIAAVANWDWPQEWPGLLENIVSSVKQRSDPNLGE
jgi:hypothetical protein